MNNKNEMHLSPSPDFIYFLLVLITSCIVAQLCQGHEPMIGSIYAHVQGFKILTETIQGFQIFKTIRCSRLLNPRKKERFPG